VRASDPRFHARRRIVIAAILFLGGIALLIYGAFSKTIPVGVAGFVVMLGSAVFAMQSYRQGQSKDLRAVGGTATRRTRQRRSSLVDRLEERWRRRPEDNS
jgi:hypothetical protein